MRHVQARPRLLALAAVTVTIGAAAVAGCGGSPAPQGSPLLTQVFWSAGGSQFLVWSRDPNPALKSPVPPFASEVDFVFDLRLDGALIEDIVTVGGQTTTHPKDPPPIQATWPDMVTMNSDPPFALIVDYNSIPTFGGNSSYLFAHPAVPGFPSSDTVSFQFVRSRITSATGEVADVPDSIPVKTEALAVSIGLSAAGIVPTFQIPLAFSNRLPPPPAMSPSIHVTLGGAAVPYKLLADAGLASRWYLAAADCLGGAWPANQTLTVTIDATFADAFGGTLAQAATATFSTNAAVTAVAGATCAIPDGGTAGDAAPPSDASDGPSLDAAPAPDAGVESPSDGDASAADGPAAD